MSTKAEFCESNVAVYYVEYVENGKANALGLKSMSSYDTYRVSVKYFTKFLDQTVTLSMTDANGKAVKATSGKFVMGVALTAASTAGSLVQVQFAKMGYKP